MSLPLCVLPSEKTCDAVLAHRADDRGRRHGAAERRRVEVLLAAGRQVEGAALDGGDALAHQRVAAVDQAGRARAVRQRDRAGCRRRSSRRAARGRRCRRGPRALLGHPGDGACACRGRPRRRCRCGCPSGAGCGGCGSWRASEIHAAASRVEEGRGHVAPPALTGKRVTRRLMAASRARAPPVARACSGELLDWSSSFDTTAASSARTSSGSAAHVTMLARTGIIPVGDARALRDALRALYDEATRGHAPAAARRGRRAHGRRGRAGQARGRDRGPAAHRPLAQRSGRARPAPARARSRRRAAARRGAPGVRPRHARRARDRRALARVHAPPARAAGERRVPRVRVGRRPLARAARPWPSRSTGWRCPWAAGACSGTSLPIDRALVARLFSPWPPTRNALHTVGDRDFALDWAWSAARVVLALGRIATDVVDFSTSEFGLVKLDGRIAAGSSMMPQKKNPDVFELVRGKSARAVGNVVAMLSLMKGLASGYNRDQQEDRLPLLEAGPMATGCARVVSLSLPHVTFDAARGARSAGRGLHAGHRSRRGARAPRRRLPRRLQGRRSPGGDGGRARGSLCAPSTPTAPARCTRRSTRTRSRPSSRAPRWPPRRAGRHGSAVGRGADRLAPRAVHRARRPSPGRTARSTCWPPASSPSPWSETMSKRDFLQLTNLSLDEARRVLSVARTLKAEPRGARTALLAGRVGRHRAREGQHADPRVVRGGVRRTWACTRWCSARRAASSGAVSPSATRRACSPATATPSCSARRPPRGCARWPPRACRSSTRCRTTGTRCRCSATCSRSRSSWARSIAGKRVAFVGDCVEQHGPVLARGRAAVRLSPRARRAPRLRAPGRRGRARRRARHASSTSPSTRPTAATS